MKFDNSDMAIKIQMQKRLVAVIVAVFVALLYFVTGFFDFLHYVTSLPKLVFTLLFLMVFVLFYIYHLLAASSFIFVSDEESKIIIRFYQLNMLNPSKNSFEIPRSEFAGYKLERKYFKIREELNLFRKYQGSIVRYPPVSINSLSPNDKNKLIDMLNRHSPKS